jgi:hypothetical protein
MLILDEDPPARGAQRGTRLSFRAGVHEDGADVGLRLRF